MTYPSLTRTAQPDTSSVAQLPWKLDLDRESAPIAGILSAAEGCFARAGYEGASMREIAEAAGVSKSLLHYHFDSKEHLFVEVQIRAYNRLATRVLAAAASVDSGAERGLLAFDALFATLQEKNDLATQAELWAGALANSRLRVHVVRLREFFRSLLVRSIDQILGAEQRVMPVSPEALADLVWATVNGLGILSAFEEPVERIERGIATLRTLAALMLGIVEETDAASPAGAARRK